MTASGASTGPTQRGLAMSVYLPSAIMAFCSGLMIPIMPLYARSFDASYGLIGVVLAAAAVGALASDIPAGLLVRRYGARRIMLVGGGGMLAGVLALVWAQSVYEVILYRMISGAGMSLWGIARHAYIAEIIRTERRGRSIAVLGGIGRVGLFLGPAAGGFLGKMCGLRSPFLLFFMLGVGALMVVRVWVHDDSRQADEAAVVPRQSLTAVLHDHLGILAAAGSGQLFGQMIRRARHIVIPLYAADVLGLDVQSVGLIISIASAVDMVMFYPAGMLMDTYGRKYAYVPSFTIQAVGMLLIPLTGSFGGLVAVACLIGLGNGLGSGTMMTLGADLAPPAARGAFLGLWRFIGDAGGAGSPLIIGAMASALGWVHTSVVMSGFGLVSAAILLFLVPETLHKSDGNEGSR
jgi:MFS family permease